MGAERRSRTIISVLVAFAGLYYNVSAYTRGDTDVILRPSADTGPYAAPVNSIFLPGASRVLLPLLALNLHCPSRASVVALLLVPFFLLSDEPGFGFSPSFVQSSLGSSISITPRICSYLSVVLNIVAFVPITVHLVRTLLNLRSLSGDRSKTLLVQGTSGQQQFIDPDWAFATKRASVEDLMRMHITGPNNRHGHIAER